jgi:hypothetical protein
MERIARYRTAIENVLTPVASLQYAIPGLKHISEETSFSDWSCPV